MSTLDFNTWQGNPREATQEVAALLLQWHPGVIAPTERVLRKWRQEEVLTHEGRRFTGRNLLEAAYVTWQRKEGISLAFATNQLREFTLNELRDRVSKQVSEPLEQPYVDERRLERTIILLAYGILKQFQAVRAGYPVSVGISNPDKRVTDAAIPLPLRQAQTQLARLSFESGQQDECASVHELLWRCTKPMREWAPRPLAEHAQYADVVLIDEEYKVPSLECGDFAELGGHLADIIENQIHQQLMQALDQLDESERSGAYTLVRKFVAENPLVIRTGTPWRKLLTNPRLNLEVRGWLDTVYEPAHAALADKQARVARCSYCHAPLIQDKHKLVCSLTACRAAHPQTKPTEPVPLADALVARPEVLKYWCNPALDELRLFKELTALFPDEQVQLFPDLDLCDVAIGTRIGIDVKDYSDPVLLARKLNRGVGGLRVYDEMVVAIASRQVESRPEYIPQVKEHLQTALRRSLRILSVDEVIDKLRKYDHLA